MNSEMQKQPKPQKKVSLILSAWGLFIFMNIAFYLYAYLKKTGMFSYTQLYVFALVCLIIMFAWLWYWVSQMMKAEN
jgi:glucan phosphoethanolaminetransferase (alkaline phosphatase superfamily)